MILKTGSLTGSTVLWRAQLSFTVPLHCGIVALEENPHQILPGKHGPMIWWASANHVVTTLPAYTSEILDETELQALLVKESHVEDGVVLGEDNVGRTWLGQATIVDLGN